MLLDYQMRLEALPSQSDLDALQATFDHIQGIWDGKC
jgi:hypothetical protein